MALSQDEEGEPFTSMNGLLCILLQIKGTKAMTVTCWYHDNTDIAVTNKDCHLIVHMHGVADTFYAYKRKTFKGPQQLVTTVWCIFVHKSKTTFILLTSD